METAPSPVVRPVTPADIPELHRLIYALAEYEEMTDEFIAREEDLKAAIFGSNPTAGAVLAEVEGKAIGFAVYFRNFSTFIGKQGMYLEDLFVEEAWRGRGIGKLLLLGVVKLAHELGCKRVDWCVLDWNQKAIDFYESLGAKVMKNWHITRLDHDGIVRLATAEG